MINNAAILKIRDVTQNYFDDLWPEVMYDGYPKVKD